MFTIVVFQSLQTSTQLFFKIVFAATCLFVYISICTVLFSILECWDVYVLCTLWFIQLFYTKWTCL